MNLDKSPLIFLTFLVFIQLFERGHGNIKIGAFNMKVFGVTKATKPEIILRYNIILLQEIRDSTNKAIKQLLQGVNRRAGSSPFTMKISERLGRTTSKEQYAFFYRKTSGISLKRSYVYNDSAKDTFEREPFVVHFGSTKTDFLDRSCGSSVSITALLLDSDTNVEYSNDVNCTYTVSVPSGCLVFAQFRRFELEYKISGVCTDYVNVYDGSSTSGTKLNSEPLCGETVADNYTSTSTSMTIHFHTDSSATSNGFDILFTKACSAPCDSGSFSCNSGICIDNSLKCDYYNNCGDRSDESGCSYNGNANVSGDVTTLIVGLTVGLGCVLIIAGIIAFFLYRHYRWRKFLRTPIAEMTQFRKRAPYPVTHLYYREGADRGYYQSVHSIEETNSVLSDQPKSDEEPTPMKDKIERGQV